jgi:Fe-S cluster assembly ATPase SufC
MRLWGRMVLVRVRFKVIAGHPAPVSSDIMFKGSSILDLDPEDRSH